MKLKHKILKNLNEIGIVTNWSFDDFNIRKLIFW